jgi:glycine cleavage system regulatory protein
MANNNYILNLIGPDRPGIVEQVAQVIADHAGNWLESRLAHLGGQFAGIVRLEAPAERHAALQAELAQLAAHGLNVSLVADDQAAVPTSHRLVRLELVGADRPGIVQQISAALARHRCNVEDFRSHVISAPMCGDPLFQASALVEYPESVDLAAIRAELERIASDLMVEVTTEQG